VAESFSTPLAFRQAAEQVAEFHRFQRLSAELTALNEQICRLRPVAPDPTGWTEAEKNGCWGSSRSRAGSPDAPPGSLCRLTQGPWFRLGSGRDGYSRGSSSSRRGPVDDALAPERRPRRSGGVRLWRAGSLPRSPLQNAAHGPGAGAVETRLLCLPVLPSGPQPAGSGTGCGGAAVFSGGTTHDGAGGQ